MLADVDGGAATAAEAIERLLAAQIALRNDGRLETAMRASRLPAVKTLADFDFAFQPSIKREQIESLHELGFLGRRENVVLLGPPGVGKTHLAVSLAIAAAQSGRRVYYGTLAGLIESLEAERCRFHAILLDIDRLWHSPALQVKLENVPPLVDFMIVGARSAAPAPWCAFSLGIPRSACRRRRSRMSSMRRSIQHSGLGRASTSATGPTSRTVRRRACAARRRRPTYTCRTSPQNSSDTTAN